MALVFYNTLSRRKEEFVPISSGQVKIYTCGPTVYDFAHIGNFRTNVFQDLLRRYLEYKGLRVTQVMNLTDIDDRIIAGVRSKKLPLREYTEPYKQAFFADLDTLGIKRADFYPEATAHVPEMAALVERLLEKGNAYRQDSSIYFKIGSFPAYGGLSHMKLDELKAGARVSADSYEKEQVSDFALWKAWDEQDGDIFWETPLGKGRPGWHLECSVMSMKYLGEHFDIHTGGVDLIFPHHENEIAQSEAATGKKFVNYWLHAEHLIVEGRKMSKSLGNFYTLRDILAKGYSPKAVRYLLLSVHYRQQLNFTFDGLEAARNAVERLLDFKRNVADAKEAAENPKVAEQVAQTKLGFEENLDDDLNISGALGVLFDFVRDMNKIIADRGLSAKDKTQVLEFLGIVDGVLGLLKTPDEELDSAVKGLIAQRDAARAQKDFTAADAIRSRLDQLGIILEDTVQGTKWKKRL